MANTQLWTNLGKDADWNGVSGALAGKTATFGFSSKAFSAFTAVDTYATRQEVTYWTGGAGITQALAASVNGSALGTQLTFSTGSQTNGPANIAAGLVMLVSSSLLLYVVDIVALVNALNGTSYTVLDMSGANEQITWVPNPLVQNVGGG